MSTPKKTNKTGYIMLLLVIILYGILFVLQPQKAISALHVSWSTLKMIVPILVVVFILMALLGYFFDEKKIVKHLGDKSGAKGWFIALLGGVLSHGPGYIWYPMLQELRDKGAKDALIIVFLYARSIKLPWIPLMISYFGIAFSVTISFYVLLGAYLQGVIMMQLSKRSSHVKS